MEDSHAPTEMEPAGIKVAFFALAVVGILPKKHKKKGNVN